MYDAARGVSLCLLRRLPVSHPISEEDAARTAYVPKRLKLQIPQMQERNCKEKGHRCSPYLIENKKGPCDGKNISIRVDVPVAPARLTQVLS